jgi:CBS domain-containing protein
LPGHSLVREELSAAEAQSKIRHSLANDSVEQLGPSEVISVPGTATAAEALAILREQHIGCVLVTDSAGKLSGIFTERDALARVAAEELDPAGIAVNDVMTPDPETVKLDHPLAHAIHLMVVGDLRHLPLIDDDGAPIGVISSRDLIDYVASLVMGREQEP